MNPELTLFLIFGGIAIVGGAFTWYGTNPFKHSLLNNERFPLIGCGGVVALCVGIIGVIVEGVAMLITHISFR